jgi:putative DNA primase/helicase
LLTEPGIPILPEHLDKDPYLLNCLNGTINLKTGTLKKHCKTDLLTKLAPVEFDPARNARFSKAS